MNLTGLQAWLVAAGMLVLIRSPAAGADTVRPASFLVRNWHLDDGLPQSSVACITQTRDGYLWFGTFNGLVRFDGMRCKVFDPENTEPLQGNRFLAVFEDSQGVIWFSPEGGGVGTFSNGQFKGPPVPELTGGSVTSITEGHAGTMWFGNVRGEVIRVSGGLVRTFSRSNGLPDGPIIRIVAGAGGQVWAGSLGWMGRLRDSQFQTDVRARSSSVAFARDRFGGVIVAAEGRLFRMAADGERTELGSYSQPLSEPAARVILEDRKGDIWVGMSSGGVIRFSGGRFEAIPMRRGAASDTVLSLAEDSEGNIWVGTQGGGLNRLRPNAFEVFDTRNGLAENKVLALCEDHQGRVWIGTDGGGLHRLGSEGIIRFNPARGITNQHIWAICEDRRTNLWVGTWGDGLFRLTNGFFEPFGKDFESHGTFIRSLYADRDGSLWIGTYRSGAYHYDGTKIRRYSQAEGLSNPDVKTIFRDREGSVWFGTGGGGLNRLRNGRITVFNEENGLPSNFIRVLFEDEKGVLWVGTSSGLARFKDGRFSAISSAHGLPDNVISQIFKDARGVFWFGSNKGIFRVNAKELEDVADGELKEVTCLLYTQADGLSGRECSGGFQPAGCKTRDGRLWFPTLEGVTVVDANGLRVNPRPPQVVIEEIRANGEPLKLGKTVRIPPRCRTLDINYTGMSYHAPTGVRFKHKLDGADPRWIEAGRQRSATYNRLPPGQYRFRVLAANSDGVWNQEGATLAFTLSAPFWRTWWFIGLSGVTGIAGLTASIRYALFRHMQRKLDDLRHKDELARERARIAADMHDQVGARLTQIGLLGELARRDATNPARIARHLDRITSKSREVAGALDEIVWTVNSSNDSLEGTAAYIVHYCDDFFESLPIVCRLDVPVTLPARMLSADVRHNLFMAFKEALANAAKHSGAREIRIRIACVEQWVDLTISDNGCGFGEKPQTGNGLPNMKSRLAEIGGEFFLSSAPGEGTTINFRVKAST